MIIFAKICISDDYRGFILLFVHLAESTALESVIIKQFLTGLVRNCFIMERILFGRWNKRHAPYVCKLFGIASL